MRLGASRAWFSKESSPCRKGFFHVRLSGTAKTGTTLECLIHAPRDTRLVIHRYSSIWPAPAG